MMDLDAVAYALRHGLNKLNTHTHTHEPHNGHWGRCRPSSSFCALPTSPFSFVSWSAFGRRHALALKGGREGGREVSWINDQPDDDGLFIDRNVANGTYRNRAGFCVLSHSYNNEGDKQNS